MQTSFLQQAKHGWNVVYGGFAYPFKTYNAACKLLNALGLLTEEKALDKLNKLRVSTERPDFIAHSYNYFIENERMSDNVIAIARAESRAKARARSAFPFFIIDYLDRPSAFGNVGGARTGRTCAGASLLANRYTMSNEAVKTAEPVSPAVSAEVRTGLGKAVTVESIDPRKIPLLAYVNAELLPDAPKDDDMSTKACWQRQAKTIGGLLADLRQRTEDLTQERTSHEITKSKVKELEGIVGRQAGSIQNQSGYISTLRDERDAYKGQVLLNRDNIAVVKYSRRDLEWHVVQNGIAWRAPYNDPFSTLVQIANSINLGKDSMGSFGLIRKPYYYKEDYA